MSVTRLGLVLAACVLVVAVALEAGPVLLGEAEATPPGTPGTGTPTATAVASPRGATEGTS